MLREFFRIALLRHSNYYYYFFFSGWLGWAMVLGSFQCQDALLLLHIVGQGHAVLAQVRDGWAIFFIFLAHLSQRLTRWAYSIAMVRRPSVVVRRRPHFQTCISLKPAGQPRSYIICSITGVGERLHKVLGQIRSKLWFPWQQKAPIDL